MSKFKIGDKVIVSRYGKPSVKGTVERVPDGLIEIFYRVRLEDGNYLNSIESDMVSAEIEKYFYCPVCGKKSLIKDAVIKRHILNKSFRLDNAAILRMDENKCFRRVLLYQGVSRLRSEKAS